MFHANVEIGEDYVTIFDSYGNELLHWIEDEWTEDPSVTLAIAQAIHTYHTKGEDAIKSIISKGKEGI